MVATAPIVLVGAIDARALITKLAGNVRMHKHAFVTILALWEELALVLVLEVGKLALSVRLVAVRPTFASLFRQIVTTFLVLIGLRSRV